MSGPNDPALLHSTGSCFISLVVLIRMAIRPLVGCKSDSMSGWMNIEGRKEQDYTYTDGYVAVRQV